MRFLVTGATGQLGLEIIDRLKEIGVNDDSILGTCFDIEKALKEGKVKNVVKMDITNPYETEKVIEEFNPDIIFHCAAWTAVDKAESEEFKDKCFEVNNYGTKNVAVNATKVGAKMVSFSTDYVFDGYSKYYKSYHTPNPINNYGRSKFGSEKMTRNYCPKSFVIRTSWLFGTHGNNFAKTMLKLAKNNDCIKVVNDQIGCPTYTKDLARVACELAFKNEYGIYHCSNSGACSWFEFAKYLLKDKDIVVPVTTEQYKEMLEEKAHLEDREFFYAERPKCSVLECYSLEKVGIECPQSWQSACDDFLSEMKELEYNKNFK